MTVESTPVTNHGSQVGEQALKFFQDLYAVEREGAELTPRRGERCAPRRPSRLPTRSSSGSTRSGRRCPTDCDCEGHRLQPTTMGSVNALPRRRVAAHRQQLGREPDPPHRARALELALRRDAARRAARRGHHEPDAGSSTSTIADTDWCYRARTRDSGDLHNGRRTGVAWLLRR